MNLDEFSKLIQALTGKQIDRKLSDHSVTFNRSVSKRRLLRKKIAKPLNGLTFFN